MPACPQAVYATPSTDIWACVVISVRKKVNLIKGKSIKTLASEPPQKHGGMSWHTHLRKNNLTSVSHLITKHRGRPRDSSSQPTLGKNTRKNSKNSEREWHVEIICCRSLVKSFTHRTHHHMIVEGKDKPSALCLRLAFTGNLHKEKPAATRVFGQQHDTLMQPVHRPCSPATGSDLFSPASQGAVMAWSTDRPTPYSDEQVTLPKPRGEKRQSLANR